MLVVSQGRLQIPVNCLMEDVASGKRCVKLRGILFHYNCCCCSFNYQCSSLLCSRGLQEGSCSGTWGNAYLSHSAAASYRPAGSHSLWWKLSCVRSQPGHPRPPALRCCCSASLRASDLWAPLSAAHRLRRTATTMDNSPGSTTSIFQRRFCE